MKVILDIEIYPNFFLLGWYDMTKKRYWPLTEKRLKVVDKIIREQRPYIISFNGQHFDLRLLKYALHRYEDSKNIVKELKVFADYIINGPAGLHPKAVELFEEFKWWDYPNLDLKNVLGGRTCPSLKKLSCRLHLKEVESLPIPPDTILTDAQKQKIITYNKTDISNTLRLFHHCRPQLEMRLELGKIYNMDLRSLSDAQIAEKILGSLVPGERRAFNDQPRPLKDFLHKFTYQTPQLRIFFDRLYYNIGCRFKKTYHPIKKKQVYQKFFEEGEEVFSNIKIADIEPPVDFKFGGLHSVHGRRAVSGTQAYDVDVASFYPHLIMRFNIFPEGLGERFLEVYKGLLDRRLDAKKNGRKTEADGLKIVLNSTFGKFNEVYSKLFDPISGASVCLHGECALLRLMDLCYQHHIGVLLVNTDGLVTDKDPAPAVKAWEAEFNMTLEVKEIEKYLIADSNNHVLLYKDGSQKVKGVKFAYEQTTSKQTNFAITRRAAVEYLLYSTPVPTTIKSCRDIHEFTAAYSKGPTILAVKRAYTPDDPGQPMPDLVRYYLGTGQHHLYRQNAKGWTRCADSEGFVVCNEIPVELPQHLDYDKYIAMTNKLLEKL